jgi:hypothetical protein
MCVENGYVEKNVINALINILGPQFRIIEFFKNLGEHFVK